MARTLSNPTVEVNNSVIGIIPNSLSFKSGLGNKTIRSQSAGGNSIQVIVTEDAETKKSMVKFSVYNTKASIDLIKTWQNSVDGNAIRLSEGSFNLAFRVMYVIEDPEIGLGADGSIEITFEGQPSL